MMVGAGWLSTVSFIILVSQALPLSTSGGVNQNLTPLSWKLRRAAAWLPGACAEGIDHGNVHARGRNSGTGWYAFHTLRPLRLRGGGDKSRYYKLLGLEQGTDDQEAIKKAYKKMALKWHPDRHQSDKETAEKKFKELSEAYQVLSDKDKKAFYDQHGEEELKASMNGSPDGKPQQYPAGFEGASGEMPAGGFHFRTSSGREFQFEGGIPGFGGSTFSDPFQIFEDFFGGSGSPRRSSREPSMHRQRQLPPVNQPLPCTLEELYRGCIKKFRVGDSPNQEIVTIEVKPGWKAGTKVSFQDLPQPVTFILEEKRHKYFERDGDDITWSCTVTRGQADKGVKLTIPLLDGSEHKITTEAGQIFHGYCAVVRGKGMPIKGGPKRGDLKIEFRVEKGDRS